LKDYLYIALGGNRHGKANRYRNLFLTMLLGGLWHGAAWTYVMWGGLHGLYLCVNHTWRALQKKTGIPDLSNNRVVSLIGMLLTFLAWSLATNVFRSQDLATAIAITKPGFVAFTDVPGFVLTNALTESLPERLMLLVGLNASSYSVAYLMLGAAAAICWLLPNTQEFMHKYKPVIVSPGSEPGAPAWISWRPSLAYACGFGAIFGLSLLMLSSVTEFFYFQF
jgi:alginate O-acetyltransferase complex protein AlgI